MKRNIIGISVIMILAVMLSFNIFQSSKNSKSKVVEHDDNVYDVSGNTETKGAAIYPDNVTFPEEGDQATDFEMEGVDGKKIKLSDLQGEKVMLNFWASWCPPCKKEMPELEKFYQAHQDDLKIVTVNVQENRGKIKSFMDANDYTFPAYLDENGEISNAYAIYTIPTTYFIGTDGKIQAPRHTGPMTYDFMNEMLSKLN